MDTDEEYRGQSPSPTLNAAASEAQLCFSGSEHSSRSLSPTLLDGQAGLSDSAHSTPDPIGLSRKRRVNDMTQFAEHSARNVKLKPHGRAVLLDFAKVRTIFVIQQHHNSRLQIARITRAARFHGSSLA